MMKNAELARALAMKMNDALLCGVQDAHEYQKYALTVTGMFMVYVIVSTGRAFKWNEKQLLDVLQALTDDIREDMKQTYQVLHEEQLQFPKEILDPK